MFRSMPVAFAVLLSLSTAYGGPLAPSKPSQIVTLDTSGAPCPFAGFAVEDSIASDGTEMTSFVIPPNQVLVVTGLEWSATQGTAGDSVTAILQTQATGTIIADYANSTTTFDPTGVAFKNDVTPQIAIRPGRTICIFVTNGTFNYARVHGFLAPDK